MRRQRLRWLLFGGAVLATLVSLGLWAILRPEQPSRVLGLRLGLSASQARSSLRTGSPGTFRTEPMGEDVALIWAPASPESEVRSVRMEIHLGQLVALRAELSPSSPDAGGPDRSITEASVLVRDRAPGAVRITWLARSCPTHAEEARALVAAPE